MNTRGTQRGFRTTAAEKWGIGAVVAVWIGGILVTLAFWGVVIWGIIELVQWVTSK